MAKKHKIALVEDDQIIQKALKEELTDAGFEVVTANDGEEGLDLIVTQEPDLALVDIVMPKMDGLTLVQELQKSSVDKEMPILMLSNLTDSKKVLEAMEEGAHDYLMKIRYRAEDVVEKVKEALEKAK
jgi:two-component system, OmpR family, alkaline phosphatase synthesis response regulator PhoP